MEIKLRKGGNNHIITLVHHSVTENVIRESANLTIESLAGQSGTKRESLSNQMHYPTH